MTGSGGSNFKRQNTVDSATIKENSARVSARPSAPKNSQTPGQLDTSELLYFALEQYLIKISCKKIFDYLSRYISFMFEQNLWMRLLWIRSQQFYN